MLLDWDREISWCAAHFNGDSFETCLKKLAFNAFFYHIWAERNRRVFNSKSLASELVLRMIITDVRMKLSAQVIKTPDSDRSRQLFHKWGIHATFTLECPIFCTWKKPPEGTVMINMDGSLSDTSAGYGAIIRNSNGDAITAAAGSTTPISITVHELQGIEAGLTLALRHNLNYVCVGTDSKVVVSIFERNNNNVPWRAISIWRKIKRLSQRFASL
ncbi:Ribonuclease H domain [Macleaya cordata]|uniref:Ribonuclease H domain n=1 Tax=Macleaya cordata TaxID=56857 RepID=A0A200RDY5_MACCD|nr:Ribonuclease H domain [Macleaya cordata]